MINQQSPAIEIRIALKEGKGMRLDFNKDKFTILDNGVLLVEQGVHSVTYLAPGSWHDVKVIDLVAAQENLLRRFGPKNETDETGIE
jgi:hypothetical protein